MSNSAPLVSVVVPVYNGENYLAQALESVLRQTFRAFEIVVVDDGSKDSTPDIARSYGSAVRYARKENGGVASAVNHGIRLARGRYISWLSHDDLFEPRKLEMQVRAVEQYESPVVCYTDVRWVDAEGHVFEERELGLPNPAELVKEILIGGPVSFGAYSVMFDRKCVEEVGFYDEAKRYTQDADMLIRFARRFPFVRVPEKLMSIRDHGDRASREKRWEAEAAIFYREWLEKLDRRELFPNLGKNATKAERARARKEMGDRFLAWRSDMSKRLAFEQYRVALRESTTILPSVVKTLASFYAAPPLGAARRSAHHYRLGTKSVLRRVLTRI